MSTNVGKRVNRIMEIALRMAEKIPGWEVSSRISDIQIHGCGYAEPGYSEPESGLVATGNWNTIDTYNRETQTREHVSDLPSRISALFEKMGVECEWSDEWSNCDDCGKLVRTSPDSYGWQQSFVIDDNGVTCHECVKEGDPSGHLESLEGEDRKCNTISSIDPSEYGYVKLEEYETGWHPGQNDDPRKVAKELRARGITRFLFNLDSVGQFDTNWSCWVKDDSEEEDEPDSYYEGADKKFGLPH